MAFLAVLISLLPAFADPAPGASSVSAPGTSAASAFVTVSHLGESDQQAALRDGQLLSHRRATDPFGNTIRGPYKGLPPVVEHPTATPGQPECGESGCRGSQGTDARKSRTRAGDRCGERGRSRNPDRIAVDP